jgi:Uma2 family endonuclease
MDLRTESGVKLTWKDFVRFPDDGRRHEILDGKHVVSPAPILHHQAVSGRIQFQLWGQIVERGLGEVFNAPFGVELALHDVVQPDLAVVLEENRGILARTKVKGTPDLVIEILSPSTRRRDRGLKKERYRRAGVPEYWVIDGVQQVVEQFVLEGEEYRLLGSHHDAVEFRGLPGVRVDLKKVW